jgi:bacterioferritin-associated ferredoxin
MSYNARDKLSTSSRKAPLDETGKKPRGFAGLDPAKMGFGIPDWLEPSSPIPTAPTRTDVPSAEPVCEIGQAPTAETSPEPRTVLEGMKVVCICKGIKKRVFWKALDDGARTKEEVNRVTGSGSGSCQGRRCGPRILEMLRNRLT